MRKQRGAGFKELGRVTPEPKASYSQSERKAWLDTEEKRSLPHVMTTARLPVSRSRFHFQVNKTISKITKYLIKMTTKGIRS
jgi:hypothetical protein